MFGRLNHPVEAVEINPLVPLPVGMRQSASINLISGSTGSTRAADRRWEQRFDLLNSQIVYVNHATRAVAVAHPNLIPTDGESDSEGLYFADLVSAAAPPAATATAGAAAGPNAVAVRVADRYAAWLLSRSSSAIDKSVFTPAMAHFEEVVCRWQSIHRDSVAARVASFIRSTPASLEPVTEKVPESKSSGALLKAVSNRIATRKGKMLLAKPIVLLLAGVGWGELRSQYQARTDPVLHSTLLSNLDSCLAPAILSRLNMEEVQSLIRYYVLLAIATGSLSLLVNACRAISAVINTNFNVRPTQTLALQILPAIKTIHEYTVKALSTNEDEASALALANLLVLMSDADPTSNPKEENISAPLALIVLTAHASALAEYALKQQAAKKGVYVPLSIEIRAETIAALSDLCASLVAPSSNTAPRPQAAAAAAPATPPAASAGITAADPVIDGRWTTVADAFNVLRAQLQTAQLLGIHSSLLLLPGNNSTAVWDGVARAAEVALTHAHHIQLRASTVKGEDEKDLAERLSEAANSLLAVALPHFTARQQFDALSSPALSGAVVRALSSPLSSAALASWSSAAAYRSPAPAGTATGSDRRTIWERVAQLKDPFLRQRLADRTYVRRLEELQQLMADRRTSKQLLDATSNEPIVQWLRSNPAMKTLIDALQADTASPAATTATAATTVPANGTAAVTVAMDSKQFASPTKDTKSNVLPPSPAPSVSAAAPVTLSFGSAPDVSTNVHSEVGFITALFRIVSAADQKRVGVSASPTNGTAADAQYTAAVHALFAIQRNLLSRVCAPLTHADAVVAPLLLTQFARVLLAQSRQIVEIAVANSLTAPALANSDSKAQPVTPSASAAAALRRSFVGSLLPAFLAGYACVVSLPQYAVDSSESSTLTDLSSIRQALVSISPASEALTAATAGTKPSTFEFDRLESLLDTPHPMDVALRSPAVISALTSGDLVSSASAAAKTAIADVLKSPTRWIAVCDSNEEVASIFDRIIFSDVLAKGAASSDRKARFALPALHTCVLCGSKFASLNGLIAHASGVGATASACASTDLWIATLRSLTSLLTAKQARRLASSSLVELPPSAASAGAVLPKSSDEWLLHPLFQNGLEAQPQLPQQSGYVFDNQPFVVDLLRGGADSSTAAAKLHRRIIDQIDMKMFVKQSELAGPDIATSLLSLIAVLLKHTGLLPDAVSTAAAVVADAKSAVPPEVVKAWRSAYGVCSEVISYRQNTMQSLCAKSGCELPVQPDSSKANKFRCPRGHVESNCITRESVSYRSIAQRFQLNSQFLLHVRPAISGSNIGARAAVTAAALAFAKNTDPQSIAWPGVIESGLRDAANRAANRSLAIMTLLSAVSPPAVATPPASAAGSVPAAVATSDQLLCLNELAAAVRTWTVSSSAKAAAAAPRQRWDHSLLNAGKARLSAIDTAYGEVVKACVQLLRDAVGAPVAASSSAEFEWRQKQALALAAVDCLHISFDPSDYSIPALLSGELLRVLETALVAYPYVCSDDAEEVAALRTARNGFAAIGIQLGRAVRRLYRALMLTCLGRLSASSGDEKSADPLEFHAFEHHLITSLFVSTQSLITQCAAPGRDSKSGAKPAAGDVASRRIERDLYDNLSLLSELLSGPAAARFAALFGSKRQSPTALIGGLCAAVFTPTSLSTRCLRRIFSIAERVLNWVDVATVNHFFLALSSPVAASADAAPAAVVSANNDSFIVQLFNDVGSYEIGGGGFRAFRTMPTASAARCSAVASCGVQLIRALQSRTGSAIANGWAEAVSRAVSAQLLSLSPALIDELVSSASSTANVESERKKLYGIFGVLAVAGAFTEPLRVGSRVHVIAADAHASTVRASATVTGFQHSKALIVHDEQPNGVPAIVERSILEPVSAYSPLGLIPAPSASASPNSLADDWRRLCVAFKHLHRLNAESKDRESELFRHVLYGAVLRVVLSSLSADAARTDGIATDVLLSALIGSPASSGGDSKSDTNCSIMSELIALAQVPIPIRGSGNRFDLERKLSHLQQLIHDYLPATQIDTKELGPNSVDVYLKAQSVFPYHAQAFANWCGGEEERIRAAAVADEQESNFTDKDEQSLMSLGFSKALVKRALLLYNDNSELAANWLLMKAGASEQKAYDEWGPEGVDFLQEKADYNAAEPARRGDGTNFDPYSRSVIIRTPQLLARGERIRRLTANTAPGGGSQSVTSVTPSTLLSQTHGPAFPVDDEDGAGAAAAGINSTLPPMSGPLAPETSPADPRRSVSLSKVCQLKREEVRLGQLLRVSTTYSAALERRLSVVTREVWRWFFLTEDNHWAPLSAADTSTLTAAYDRGWTSAWIGQRDNNPSLVRLDKMCMFNEITGHGRPIRRRLVESETVDPLRVLMLAGAVGASPALVRQSSSSSTSPVNSGATPSPSMLPAPNFPPDDRDLAEPVSPLDTAPDNLRRLIPDLQAMGFAPLWCLRALQATNGNTEQAVMWIFNHTNDLTSSDRRDDAARRDRQRKREERKKAREDYKRHKDEFEARQAAAAKAKAAADQKSGSAVGDSKGTPPAAVTTIATPAAVVVSDEKKSDSAALPTSAGWSDAAIHPVRSIDTATTGVDIIRYAGMIGTVIKLDNAANPKTIATAALLQFEDPESGQRVSVWSPIDALEWPDRWVVTQFPELVLSPARRTTGVAGLTTDVSIALSRVLARHAVLQILHSALTFAAANPTAKLALAPIKGLEPAVLLTIIRLTLPSVDVASGAASLRGLAGLAALDSAPALASASVAPNGSPLSPKKDEKSLPVASPVLVDEKSGGGAPPRREYGDLAYHARGLIWDLLRLLILNSNATAPAAPAIAALLSADFTRQLLPQLVTEMVRHLKMASYRVKEIESQHPYTSGIKVFGLIRLENAADILLQFDRRCNVNMAHASFVCYNDPKAEREIGSYSGSDEFADTIVSGQPAERFWYSVVSGGLRQGTYEFGLLVRIIPLRDCWADEHKALKESTLGWNIVSLIADHFDKFTHDATLYPPILNSVFRYLTVAHAPFKVYLTRSFTHVIAKCQSAFSAAKVKELHDTLEGGTINSIAAIMDKLCEVHSQSRYGYSPLFQSLVDLIRVLRPFELRTVLEPGANVSASNNTGLSSAVWTLEKVLERPASWYFLELLKLESLTRALGQSGRVPHDRCLARALDELSDLELLKWAIKQPEMCLKLSKQARNWDQIRTEWLKRINAINKTTITKHSNPAIPFHEILITLKQSLAPVAFKNEDWCEGKTGRDWEVSVKKATTLGAIANLYVTLEEAMRWESAQPEEWKAFVGAWSIRRNDWVIAMKGIVRGSTVSLPTSLEMSTFPWTNAMDEALVEFANEQLAKSSRRVLSVTFRDLTALSRDDEADARFKPLKDVSLAQLRARFAVFRLLSDLNVACLPYVDLSVGYEWSLGPLIRRTAKTKLFFQAKVHVFKELFGRLYCEERPQFVILNRAEANNPRPTRDGRLRHSLFYQLYAHVGRLTDPASLRRRGQSWMVKFVGEGGHDVGGLYNESVVDLCNELQSDTITRKSVLPPTAAGPAGANEPHLPFLRLAPNGAQNAGENRNKFIPNSSAQTNELLAMFEFIGRLMGISCLDSARALPLDVGPVVWKMISGERLTSGDLKSMDVSTANTIERLRAPAKHQITDADSFDAVFGSELRFTTVNSAGVEVELMRGGRNVPVRWGDGSMTRYANALESYRLREFERQVRALCHGIASVVPIAPLSLFSSRQLEVLCTGNPEVDIDLLRDKTEYRGSLGAGDRHVRLFWSVLKSFSNEDRKRFLQFVWGRNRLPASSVGFGRDLFKLSDHPQGHNTSVADKYLPVSHTCFFALELPRYSSETVMRNKLLYAITNCLTVDGDTTLESNANRDMKVVESDDR